MSRHKFIATYYRKRLTDREQLNALQNNQAIRGMPIGVVVATRNDDGKVCFGHSMCHHYDQSRFSKKRAIKMAIGRALDEKIYPTPNGLKGTLNKDFIKRCETYFREEGLSAFIIGDKNKSYAAISRLTSEGESDKIIYTIQENGSLSPDVNSETLIKDMTIS